MKRLHCLFLALVLLACEDSYEDTHRYTKIITQSKAYPVYLDMSDISNIQVKAELPLTSPFRIQSNNSHYFVGEKMKGVHVYERKAAGVSYLCFIECLYIKDFELIDHRLFCNNLTDLVVIDVSNPLQINILYRWPYKFNSFTSYKTSWNLPFTEGKGLIAGSETHDLTGVVTDQKPELDFTEFDQQFANLTTKVVPDTWFSDHPEKDIPYIGMIKVGTDEIYSYGTYNSWSILTFRSGNFSGREENLWTTPRGRYAPPYYYSNAFPVRMFTEDNVIYIVGSENNLNKGYIDCIIYDMFPSSQHLYFPAFKPLDICYMPGMNAFLVLSGTSVWRVDISGDGVSGYTKTYTDYQIATDATEMFRAGDKLVTLGNDLSVYAVTGNGITLVKNYPGISAICSAREGQTLATATTQGLFLYDITDLENIQPIP